MQIFRRFSSWWAARKAAKHQAKLLARFSKIPEFRGERLDKLLTLVRSEEFLLFLEYLGLTVQEKLTILSNIDLLDETQCKKAIRLQLQMQGLMQAYDIANYLVELVKPKEEDN